MKTKAMTQSELAGALGLTGGQATVVRFKDPIEISIGGKVLRERIMKVVSVSVREESNGKTYVDVHGLDTCFDANACIVWSELKAPAKRTIQERIFESLTMEAE